MKSLAVILIAIIAGASATAVPQVEVDERQAQRWISGAVASAIEDLSNNIKQLGYDPFRLEATALNYGLPVPDLFSASAFLEDFLVVGASDIVINQVSYWVITSRANFDISLPSIEISLRHAGFSSTILNSRLDGNADGRITIKDLGIKGEVRVSVGIFSGISINAINLDFYLGAIDSQINNLVLFGTNFATFANNLLNINLYNAIVNSYGSINDMLEIIAWQVVDEVM